MKWVVLVEVILTVAAFVAGHYIERTSASPDDSILAAWYYFLGIAGVVITLVTAVSWWVYWISFIK